jgi:hypothetical protein
LNVELVANNARIAALVAVTMWELRR